jgi:hypothetical protein
MLDTETIEMDDLTITKRKERGPTLGTALSRKVVHHRPSLAENVKMPNRGDEKHRSIAHRKRPGW